MPSAQNPSLLLIVLCICASLVFIDHLRREQKAFQERLGRQKGIPIVLIFGSFYDHSVQIIGNEC